MRWLKQHFLGLPRCDLVPIFLFYISCLFKNFSDHECLLFVLLFSLDLHLGSRSWDGPGHSCKLCCSGLCANVLCRIPYRKWICCKFIFTPSCLSALFPPWEDLEHWSLHLIKNGFNLLQKQEIEGRSLLNRLGTTQDMAAATAFLASDDAAYITGETLVVGGGTPSRL